MNDIDEAVLTAMRVRGDGEVEVEELLRGARHRGMRRRRLRTAMTGAGIGVAVVAVVAGTSVVVPGLRSGPSGNGGPVGGPAEVGVSTPPGDGTSDRSRPPVAAGEAALGSGGALGAGLFHLDVTDPAAGSMRWRNGPGWELLSVSRPDDDAARYTVYELMLADSDANLAAADAAENDPFPGRSTSEEATVGGLPATLTLGQGPTEPVPWAILRWQPAAGVRAQLQMAFRADPAAGADVYRTAILDLAALVRFDRVFRCAVSFRLPSVPAGTEVTGCGFGVFGTTPVSTSVWLAAAGSRFSVSAWAGRDTAKPVTPNVEMSGQPMEYAAGRVRRVVGDQVVALEPGISDSLPQEYALQIVSGCVLVPSSDPSAWPSNPVR
jgi:hypothetical protein